jgi:hypothetical protein
MANVPLSPEDCERAAQAVRRHALWLLVGKQRNPHESALHRDLANRFEAAARLGRQPVVPEDVHPTRMGPPPSQVDTFPVCAEGDGIERCASGRDKHPGCYMAEEEEAPCTLEETPPPASGVQKAAHHHDRGGYTVTEQAYPGCCNLDERKVL